MARSQLLASVLLPACPRVPGLVAQASSRGVKSTGATAQLVHKELDKAPDFALLAPVTTSVANQKNWLAGDFLVKNGVVLRITIR